MAEIRESSSSFVLITLSSSAEARWLAQWNEHWTAFNFVGGHREPGESYRDCAIREMHEELGLIEGSDFKLSEQPLKSLKYEAWSRRAKAETRYDIALFATQFSEMAAAAVSSDVANRWLTKNEIAVRQTHDGRPISDIMSRFLLELI